MNQNRYQHYPSLLFRVVLIIALSGLVFAFSPLSIVHAAALVVNSHDDSDDGTCDAVDCTLREAINEANASQGPDVITFDLGGADIIALTKPLPSLTGGNITIRADGKVNVYGSNAGSNANGLVIESSGNRIQGLIISTFSKNGILILGPGADNNIIGVDDSDGMDDSKEGNEITYNSINGILILLGDDNVVAGNIVGLFTAGGVSMDPAPNHQGIQIWGGNNNRIGTNENKVSDALERNVISSSDIVGVYVRGDNNQIVGNYIGTDTTGTLARGNGNDGLVLANANGNLVKGNVISANAANGIGISASSHNVVILNVIGTDKSGTVTMGNAFNGIRIFAFDGTASNFNQIGSLGTYAKGLEAAGNIIANSSWNGIWIDSYTEGNNAFDNSILYNSIHDNGLLGIDLVGTSCPIGQCTDFVTLNDSADNDGGGNHAMNFPEIASAKTDGTSTFVSAQMIDGLPSTSFVIQFFSGPTCNAYGYGEGQTFLGEKQVTTDALGNATTGVLTIQEAVPVGSFVTATATNRTLVALSTSEFSRCMQVVPGNQFLFAKDIIWMLKLYLLNLVNSRELDSAQAEALYPTLDMANAYLDRQDADAAIGELKEFIRQVRGLIHDDALPRETGQALIHQANQGIRILRDKH